jgi:phage regulator Rha-like protein
MDALTPCNDLALTTTTIEPRVDTRLLAGHLGNKHKPVIALLDKYLASFKAHGQVLFKKADGDRKQGGGRAERYALLNEDQAYFLLSLSRNTDTVVTLKSKLVTAFGQARRAADLRKTEYLPGYHELHDTMHALANPLQIPSGSNGNVACQSSFIDPCQRSIIQVCAFPHSGDTRQTYQSIGCLGCAGGSGRMCGLRTENLTFALCSLTMGNRNEAKNCCNDFRSNHRYLLRTRTFKLLMRS